MLRESMPLMVLAGFIACAGTQSTLWISPEDSEHIPVINVESPSLQREVVITTRIPGIDVPKVMEDVNSSGRMVITVSIRNNSRSQQMADVKVKFFDTSGRNLDALGDWNQVFVNPGEIKQVEFTCGEINASFFKVLLR